MLPLLSCEQMRRADSAAIKAGIPARVLMENAASFALRVILAEKPAYVAVFCGKGNNAGDGLALARRLFVAGIKTEIVIMSAPSDLAGDTAENFSAARRLHIPIVSFDNYRTRAISARDTLFVDALLGTGIRGKVQGVYADAIAYMNESGVPVYALDIPSGISGDTGRVCGICVQAAKTITFGYRKLGLYSPLALPFTGEIVCDDISIPPLPDIQNFLTERQDIRLPYLSPAAHKGMRGHAFIVGGQPGMLGAVYMAAAAAELAGAGLTTAVVPPEMLDAMMVRLTGAMCAENTDLSILQKATAILVGNGMGRNEEGKNLLNAVCRAKPKTLVIDADGLYHTVPNHLQDIASEVILTPHMGEMSRLSGLSVSEITENRVQIAAEFAAAYRVTLALKGAYTVVAFPDGQTYTNTTGNAGMAKGGSGDVLAGLITGLAASGAENPALAGVYLHGLAGDMAAKAEGSRSMTAASLLKFLPYVIKCM